MILPNAPVPVTPVPVTPVPVTPVPVTIVTGFLGSGKTTLLSRLLRTEGFARTAVIINEFGEIGLDHELIATADESLVQLTTGCLCCAVRGDLTRTLLELAERGGFERVVVETSGLADPAPILHALMADAAVGRVYALHQVVTVVDAVHGAVALEAHEEARRQVAVADRVLFSKTDLCEPGALRGVVAGLNPLAMVGDIRDADVVSGVLVEAFGRERAAMAWMASGSLGARHTAGIGTAVVVRDRAVAGAALALWLEALAAHAGARLLRVKGIVEVAEAPGRPAVIHGVQHVFSPPEWLEGWPSSDRRTRVVVIGRGIPAYWPVRLLDAIEAEVLDEQSRHAGAG